MMPSRTSMDRATYKGAILYIDQWGNRFWAATRKALVDQLGGGRVSIMYADKSDGRVVRCGYVIGRHWLSAFIPMEVNASA